MARTSPLSVGQRMHGNRISVSVRIPLLTNKLLCVVVLSLFGLGCLVLVCCCRRGTGALSLALPIQLWGRWRPGNPMAQFWACHRWKFRTGKLFFHGVSMLLLWRLSGLYLALVRAGINCMRWYRWRVTLTVRTVPKYHRRMLSLWWLGGRGWLRRHAALLVSGTSVLMMIYLGHSVVAVVERRSPLVRMNNHDGCVTFSRRFGARRWLWNGVRLSVDGGRPMMSV